MMDQRVFDEMMSAMFSTEPSRYFHDPISRGVDYEPRSTEFPIIEDSKPSESTSGSTVSNGRNGVFGYTNLSETASLLIMGFPLDTEDVFHPMFAWRKGRVVWNGMNAPFTGCTLMVEM